MLLDRPGPLIAALVGALALVAGCDDSERVVVPDVVGLPADRAVQIVCGRFLEPRIEEAEAVGPAGAVVATEPAAGREVDVDSGITLRVASPDGAAGSRPDCP